MANLETTKLMYKEVRKAYGNILKVAYEIADSKHVDMEDNGIIELESTRMQELVEIFENLENDLSKAGVTKEGIYNLCL